MTSINDHHKGLKVTALDTRVRRYPVGFPGWGTPDAASFLLPIPAGAAGTITSVESHGSAPYTRYSVRFEDDTHASGLVLGRDLKLA